MRAGAAAGPDGQDVLLDILNLYPQSKLKEGRQVT